MFNPTERNGQFIVDGFETMTFMCVWTNLAVLLDFGSVTGNDTRVSGGGFVLNPRRFNGLDRTLTGLLDGDVDQDGGAHDDGIDGWITNELYLRANITDPPSNADQTRFLEILWGGRHFTALGRVGPLEIGDSINEDTGSMKMTCDVSLPIAPFVEVED